MVLVCNDPVAAGALLDGLGQHDNPARFSPGAHARPHPLSRSDLLLIRLRERFGRWATWPDGCTIRRPARTAGLDFT